MKQKTPGDLYSNRFYFKFHNFKCNYFSFICSYQLLHIFSLCLSKIIKLQNVKCMKYHRKIHFSYSFICRWVLLLFSFSFYTFCKESWSPVFKRPRLIFLIFVSKQQNLSSIQQYTKLMIPTSLIGPLSDKSLPTT